MSGAESWELLYMPKTTDGRQSGDGHKVFKSNIDGQVAVADWSAYYPDATDDGILYVSTNRPTVLSISVCSMSVLAAVPVWHLRGQKLCTVVTTLDTLDALRRHIRKLDVQMDARLTETLQALMPYMTLTAPAREQTNVGA